LLKIKKIEIFSYVFSFVIYIFGLADLIKMNSILTTIAIAMDTNAPPGITHPLLVEKYDWVDIRLRELYYGYALTADNYDEFKASGLFLENYAWIDRRLEEMYNNEGKVLMLAPFTWVNYRNQTDKKFNCLLEEDNEDNSELVIKRKRSNDDISDYMDAIDRAIKRVKLFEIDTNYYDEECEMDNLSDLTEDVDEEWFEFEPEPEPTVNFWTDNDLQYIMFGQVKDSLPEKYECWNLRKNIPRNYKCWTY
jgi:hypothetical protein